MAEFNPDLLVKDELCYEALLRGLKHVNVTVSELRKSLRQTGSETTSQLDNLRELDYDGERETCYAKYRELIVLSQNLKDKKSPTELLRATQRIEHLTRRLNNLLSWPDVTVVPADVQKFADEALSQLPIIINDLRRKSDASRMEEIEQDLQKLYISPVQSPTVELPPTTSNPESPTVSKIQLLSLIHI